jgi:hypothetical protein
MQHKFWGECISVISGKARMKNTIRPLGRPNIGGWIIRWILERKDEVVWNGLVWLCIGTSEGL